MTAAAFFRWGNVQETGLQLDEWQAILQGGARTLGLTLDASQVESCYRHMCELRHWNRRVNLTAITEPKEIAIKHFLDALAAADQVKCRMRILDVGSGAGFPGIPLKIIRPSCHVTLIDSARKKINFLRHVGRQLDLDRFVTVHARIEAFAAEAAGDQQFDMIVSRAFTRAADLTRSVMPLLRRSGSLLLWKGPQIDDEIAELRALSADLEEDLAVRVKPYRLPITGFRRHLIAVKLAAQNAI